MHKFVIEFELTDSELCIVGRHVAGMAEHLTTTNLPMEWSVAKSLRWLLQRAIRDEKRQQDERDLTTHLLQQISQSLCCAPDWLKEAR